MIIVLEGIDNCGKTTISEMLYEYILSTGKKVHISRELTTKVGSLIKNMIRDGGLSPILKTFLFAADRQIRLENIEKENDIDIIIMDRYIHSAIVYREAEGLDHNWVSNVNAHVKRPDFIFYIDISPEESIKRNNIDKFNIIYKEEFLNKVRNSYLQRCENKELIYIDGMRDVGEVFNDILNLIKL